jgi:hypothetical protein
VKIGNQSCLLFDHEVVGICLQKHERDEAAPSVSY